MTAPTWDQYMAPSLRVLSDGEIHPAHAIKEAAADMLELTRSQRTETIASGQLRYINRASWALSHLALAKATERPERARYRITDIGRDLLARHPEGITERDLRDLPSYGRSRHGSVTSGAATVAVLDGPAEALDPIEQIEAGIARIQVDVAADLLDRLHTQSPAFFEQAVLDLLMAMGYGGANGTATRTQLSNDGGIDGIVDQDALGLSRIYVQAKRYAPDTNVSRPEVQAFVGALSGAGAGQGVFITTGSFTGGALTYAHSIAARVVLVDGQRLTSLMIRYGVGVQVKRTVEIVETDEDYFE